MTEIKPVNIIDYKDVETTDYDPQTKLAIYTVKMGLAKAIDACHNGRIFYIGGRPFHVVKLFQEDPRSWSRLSIRRMVNNNDQRKRVYAVCGPMRCKAWNRHELRGVRGYPQVVPFPHVPILEL